MHVAVQTTHCMLNWTVKSVSFLSKFHFSALIYGEFYFSLTFYANFTIEVSVFLVSRTGLRPQVVLVGIYLSPIDICSVFFIQLLSFF